MTGFADIPEDSVEDTARTAAELRAGTFRLGLERLQVVLPQWPVQPQRRTVRSFSDPIVAYEVDLALLTCTCADFSGRRARYSMRDARRVCKHLLAELRREDLLESVDEVCRTLIESGYAKDQLYRALGRSRAVIAVSPDEPWIDVYARTKGGRGESSVPENPYQHYGWHVVRKEWSYGKAPIGAGEIRKLLQVSGLASLAAGKHGAETDLSEILASKALDPLFDSAVSLARHQGFVSRASLQRQLKVGFGRAARLAEELERTGIVGPADTSGVHATRASTPSPSG